jgi:hypothetical protein
LCYVPNSFIYSEHKIPADPPPPRAAGLRPGTPPSPAQAHTSAAYRAPPPTHPFFPRSVQRSPRTPCPSTPRSDKTGTPPRRRSRGRACALSCAPRIARPPERAAARAAQRRGRCALPGRDGRKQRGAEVASGARVVWGLVNGFLLRLGTRKWPIECAWEHESGRLSVPATCASCLCPAVEHECGQLSVPATCASCLCPAVESHRYISQSGKRQVSLFCPFTFSQPCVIN